MQKQDRIPGSLLFSRSVHLIGQFRAVNTSCREGPETPKAPCSSSSEQHDAMGESLMLSGNDEFIDEVQH